MVAAGLGIKRSLAEAAVRSDLVERVRLENELGEIPPRCLAGLRSFMLVIGKRAEPEN